MEAATSTEDGAAALFGAIYDAELPYVWRSLRRLGVPARDVEDVAHDLFVRVYHNLASYERSRPLRPWLFGFAFRVASEYRRKAGHARELLGEEEAVPAASVDASGERRVARRQARELVMEALEAVALERRAVFVLHEIDGHSIPEVAEALELPLNTAYSRLRLAREEFTEAVERAREETGGGHE